jgi:hypothetical protein
LRVLRKLGSPVRWEQAGPLLPATLIRLHASIFGSSLARRIGPPALDNAIFAPTAGGGGMAESLVAQILETAWMAVTEELAEDV